MKYDICVTYRNGSENWFNLESDLHPKQISTSYTNNDIEIIALMIFNEDGVLVQHDYLKKETEKEYWNRVSKPKTFVYDPLPYIQKKPGTFK